MQYLNYNFPLEKLPWNERVVSSIKDLESRLEEERKDVVGKWENNYLILGHMEIFLKLKFYNAHLFY